MVLFGKVNIIEHRDSEAQSLKIRAEKYYLCVSEPLCSI